MGGFGSGKSRSRIKAWRSKKLYTTNLQKLEVTKLIKIYHQNPEIVIACSNFDLKINESFVSLTPTGTEEVKTSDVKTSDVKTPLIKLKKQPCHFGGFRYFFICPFCNKQVTSLHVFMKTILACRCCLNMVYPCQNQTLSYRLLVKARKASQLINEDVWTKPKWMRKNTFKRLREQYFDYDNMSDLADMFSLKSLRVAKALNKRYGGAIDVPMEVLMAQYGKWQ